MTRVRATAGGVLAFLAVHVLLAFRWPWEPAHDLRAWFVPSADLPLFLGVTAAFAMVRGYRAWFAHLLAVALGTVFLWHLAATLVPTFYGKDFEPWNDVLMVPGLAHLLVHRWAEPLQWAAGLLALLLAGGAWFGLFTIARSVLRSATVPRVSGACLLLAQVLVVARWCEISALAPDRTSRITRESTVMDVLAHAGSLLRGDWRTESDFPERARVAQEELARTPHDLAHLRDVDVFLIFVESYGRGILKTSGGDGFRARMRARAERLAALGIHSVTASTFPAIRGGMSSLAHAELLTGVAVPNRRIFDLVLRSDLVALGKLFASAGHRTVSVQPAMPRAWPEGKLFGFTEDVFRPELPYDGHVYPWGDMPDQFALAHVLERIVAPARDPLFLMFVSVTSHAPFSAVPPYLADWSRATTPGAFAGPPARTFPITWTDYTGNPRLLEAYVATIDYALDSAFGFVERLPRRSLVIVLGDHQPPLAGDYAKADASHDVPIHVLSRDPALLTPFAENGFVAGLVPAESTVAFPAERFLVRFVRWFSGGGPDSAPANPTTTKHR